MVQPSDTRRRKQLTLWQAQEWGGLMPGRCQSTDPLSGSTKKVLYTGGTWKLSEPVTGDWTVDKLGRKP